MVANRQVQDEKEEGTPSSNSQRTGSVSTLRTIEVRRAEAVYEEERLLNDLARLRSQTEAIEANLRRIRDESSNAILEVETEIQQSSRSCKARVETEIQGCSPEYAKGPIDGVGMNPMKGDDVPLKSPKDLAAPAQGASSLTAGEKYNFSENYGEEGKKATRHMEIGMKMDGMKQPLRIEHNVVLELESTDPVKRRNAERLLKEQICLQMLKEIKMEEAHLSVSNSYCYEQTPQAGGPGRKGKMDDNKAEPRPSPKRGAAYTAPPGSSWRQNQPRRTRKRSESPVILQDPEVDEGDEGDEGESSSSPDEEESDEEAAREMEKLKLKRSRKAAPNPKLCASLIKTSVKLNSEANNYRAWLISLQETSLSQGWPNYILDNDATKWIEPARESVSTMKSRREAYQVILGTLDNKLLPSVESVREGKGFGNAQLLYRKIQLLYSPTARIGEHRSVMQTLLNTSQTVVKLNITEYGAYIVKLAADLRDMDEEVPEKTLIEIYLVGVVLPLKEYANHILDMYIRGDPKYKTLALCSTEMEVYASRHGHTRYFHAVKQHSLAAGKETAEETGESLKSKNKKKSENRKIKQSASQQSTVRCQHADKCIKKICHDKHDVGHTREIGIKNLTMETGGPCDRCKSYFHAVDECPKGTASEKKCFKCKQTGHIKRDCQSVQQNLIKASGEGDELVTIRKKGSKVKQNVNKIKESLTADGIRKPIYQFRTHIEVLPVLEYDDGSDEVSEKQSNSSEPEEDMSDDMPGLYPSSTESEGEEEVSMNVTQVLIGTQSLTGNTGKWYLDSGAQGNSHNPVTNPGTNPKKVTAGTVISGFVGPTLQLDTTEQVDPPQIDSNVEIVFRSYSVPGSNINLLSMGALLEEGCEVKANKNGATVSHDGEVFMYAKLKDRMLELQPEMPPEVIKQNVGHVSNFDTGTLKVLHDTVGHWGFDYLRKIFNFPRASNDCPDPVCTPCLEAQYKNRKIRLEALTAAPRKGFRICTDVSGIWPRTTYAGKTDIQRFQLHRDEYTGKGWVTYMQRKDQCKKEVATLIGQINAEIAPFKVAEHQTDGGKEYLNKWLNEKLAEQGAKPRNSEPHCQYQNGVIESYMDVITKSAKAMLYRGHAPEEDWPYAINHAVYLSNEIPDGLTDMSPNFKWSGIEQNDVIKKLTKMGPLFCGIDAKRYEKGKWQRKAEKNIFLGKSPHSPGVLMRPVGGKIDGRKLHTGEVVTYDRTDFPYSNLTVPRPKPSKQLTYGSDTDQDAGEPVHDADEDYEQDTSSDDSEDLNDGGVEEEEQHSSNPREPIEKKTMPEPVKVPEYIPDGLIGAKAGYEVVEILNHRTRRKNKRKRTEYLVRWKGDWPDEWISSRALSARELIKAYEEKKGIDSTAEQKVLQNVVLRMCAGRIELMTNAENELPENNEFKDLFDPKTQTRVPDPVGEKELESHPYREQFMLAKMREKMENIGWKTYVEVPRSEVPPGTKILRSVIVYCTKYNSRGEIEKFKVRVCLDGSRIQVDESETYESIANFSIIRMLLCMAIRYDCGIAVTDVKNFFLQAKLPVEKQYYANIPDGWETKTKGEMVAKCLAPWYGLPEAAKLAGDQLAAALLEVGLQENPWFPKVFSNWFGEDFVCCATHIDDAPWIFNNKDKFLEIVNKLDVKFKLKINLEPTQILGCQLDWDKKRGIFKLHQGSFNKDQYGQKEKFKAVRSPGFIPQTVPNPVLDVPQKPATPEEIKAYQKRVGCLNWGGQTDPSSCYTTRKLAKHMLNPQKVDWEALERQENYKRCFPEIGAVWRRADPPQKLTKGMSLDCMTWFVDADWAADKENAKSVTGWCTHFGDSGMFDWCSKQQTCVSQSSCESEVTASQAGTNDALHKRQGLSVMGFTFTKPSPICQDNGGAIAMCKSDKHHSRTRHFRVHVNVLRDAYNRRICYYPWIPTAHMKGDLFNKIHQPADHERLVIANGISAARVDTLPDKGDKFEVDGWLDRVMKEKAIAARVAGK